MLVDTLDHIEHAFIEEGLSDDNAINLARIAVVTLSIHISRDMMYLPRGELLQKALTNAKIYKLFDGNNTAKLAIKFNLSRQPIIDILKIKDNFQKPHDVNNHPLLSKIEQIVHSSIIVQASIRSKLGLMFSFELTRPAIL